MINTWQAFLVVSDGFECFGFFFLMSLFRINKEFFFNCIFGCAGSFVLCVGFAMSGGYSPVARASHCGGISGCRAPFLGLAGFSNCGTRA